MCGKGRSIAYINTLYVAWYAYLLRCVIIVHSGLNISWKVSCILQIKNTENIGCNVLADSGLFPV